MRTRQSSTFRHADAAASGVLGVALAVFFVLSAIFFERAWRPDQALALQKTSLYSIFGGLALVGAFTCLLCFARGGNAKINGALALLSSAFSLYALEFCLTLPVIAFSLGLLKYPGTPGYERQAAIVRPLKIFFDMRTEWQVIADLSERGISAVPAVLPVHFSYQSATWNADAQPLPLGGISNTLTILCNESGAHLAYVSDEHGFNNPAGVFSLPTLDMALVGDSFTHGYCVRRADDLAGHLRRAGNTVLNLGMGGNGPLHELAALNEFAAPLRPAVVLWVYYEGNDFDDLSRDAANAVLMRYFDEDFSQGLLGRQAEVDALERQYVAAIQDKHFWFEQQKSPSVLLKKFLKLWRLRNLFGLSPVPAPRALPPAPFETLPVKSAVAFLTQILAKAKAMTSDWGGSFHVVYLPAKDRYDDGVDQARLHHRERILTALWQANIDVIDIHETFSQQRDPLSLIPFRGRGHYTEKGYRLAAEAIDKALRRSVTPATAP